MSAGVRIAHAILPSARARWSLGLVVALARKDFQTRFKRSYFGIVWILVQPVMQAVVLFFVVVKVFKVRHIDNYPLFALSGVMPWAFTTQALNAGTVSIAANASLVKKVRVPLLTFPMAAVAGYLLGFLAPLSLLVLASTATGVISGLVVLLPAVLLLHYAVVVSAATLTSGLYVFYHDIRNLVESLMALLLYATPVMYELSLLPPWARPIVRCNPMTGVLSLYRAMFTGRAVDGLAVALTFVFLAVVAPIAVFVFHRRSGEFADLV